MTNTGDWIPKSPSIFLASYHPPRHIFLSKKKKSHDHVDSSAPITSGYAPCDHSLHISCNQRIFSALLRPRRAPTRPRPPLRHSSLSTSSRLIASTHVSTRYRTSNLRRIVDCFRQHSFVSLGWKEIEHCLL